MEVPTKWPRKNLNSGKEKMKTLGTRIYSTRTNYEGRDYSLGRNKNKIYSILFKCDVRMDPISDMLSPRSLSNYFYCWLNPFAFHSPGVSQQILVGVSLRHLKIKEEFLLNLARSLKDSWF